jgi:hypothetical protein
MNNIVICNADVNYIKIFLFMIWSHRTHSNEIACALFFLIPVVSAKISTLLLYKVYCIKIKSHRDDNYIKIYKMEDMLFFS